MGRFVEIRKKIHLKVVKKTHRQLEKWYRKNYLIPDINDSGIEPDCQEKMALRKSMYETGSKET